MTVSMPASTASSITTCKPGTSPIGSNSFGITFVSGRNRVPRPAAGITASRARTFATIERACPAPSAAKPEMGRMARAPGAARRPGCAAAPVHGTIWHSEHPSANPSGDGPTGADMPTYVYKFIDTGETIEVQQSFSDPTLTEYAHPGDGVVRQVKKVFQPIGVTFKGNGFYKTDNRGGSSSSSSTSGSSGGSSSDGRSSSASSSDSSSSSSTSSSSSSGSSSASSSGSSGSGSSSGSGHSHGGSGHSH
jgi:predicted nucleic acid-binding Zn ribbon protein